MTIEMIVKELPRVADTPLPSPIVLLPSSEETLRNNLIKELVAKSPLFIGQRVKPYDNTVFDTKGYARIIGIARTYGAYKGTMTEDQLKWDGNPMLVAARYEKDGDIVNATINYFVPA